MEISKALAQIAEIHGHLAKAEVYRGCRSASVALTGVVAIAGGVLQPWVVSEGNPMGFVRFWVGIAVVNVLAVALDMGCNYFFTADLAGRRVTRKMLGQFLPCVAAGAAMTFVLMRLGDEFVSLLPGLWAVLFSLGIFSARPYLPRTIGWVALGYLLGGSALLWMASQGTSLMAWGMATVFGLGQLFIALVLYWNFERREDA